MADKNKLLRKCAVGILTFLFTACVVAFIIEGLVLLEAYTSLSGWTSSAREGLPLWYAFGVGAIIFFFLKRKVANK